MIRNLPAPDTIMVAKDIRDVITAGNGNRRFALVSLLNDINYNSACTELQTSHANCVRKNS